MYNYFNKRKHTDKNEKNIKIIQQIRNNFQIIF